MAIPYNKFCQRAVFLQIVQLKDIALLYNFNMYLRYDILSKNSRIRVKNISGLKNIQSIKLQASLNRLRFYYKII